MKRTAHAAVLAPARAPAAPPADPVDALRRRLAGSTAREHVLLDFLQDDLREAREALAEVGAWVASVEGALADREASPERILSLALGGGPVERIDYLGEVLGHVRRRLAQVAARM
jgi:hypothetical protein